MQIQDRLSPTDQCVCVCVWCFSQAGVSHCPVSTKPVTGDPIRENPNVLPKYADWDRHGGAVISLDECKVSQNHSVARRTLNSA